MKKVIKSLLLMLMLITVACGDEDKEKVIEINGNGMISESYFTVKPFTTVNVTGNYNLVYKNAESGEYRVFIEGESNLIPYILYNVSNGVLSIDIENGYKLNKTLPITITLTSPDDLSFNVYDDATLELRDVHIDKSYTVSLMGDAVFEFDTIVCKQLKLVSSGTSIVEGVKAESTSLIISMQESSRVNIYDVNVENVEVVSMSAGDCILAGQATIANFRTQSSGAIKAAERTFKNYDLFTLDANILIESTGYIFVNASNSLKGSIMGAGDLYYRGDIEPQVILLGSGEVHKLD